jgi:hypothetical protein
MDIEEVAYMLWLQGFEFFVSGFPNVGEENGRALEVSTRRASRNQAVG